MTADQAWDQLRYLAGLLRDRQPIPDELADFLADAIEASEGKPLADVAKAKALTDELGLTAQNRRKIDIPLLEIRAERDFGDGDEPPSQNQAAKLIGQSYGVSQATAINRLRDLDDLERQGIEELRNLSHDPD